MTAIRDEILAFVDSIARLWDGEPLDGDETASIATAVLKELDIRNGNGDAQ